MLAAYIPGHHHSPSEIQTCDGVVAHTRRDETFLTLFCPVLPAKVPFQSQTAVALLSDHSN